jgi:nucleotide-binding universal stress UspA family protein
MAQLLDDMFKKVLWATDGSEPADRALPLARGLVGESGGELLVIHCTELTLPGKAGGRFPVSANEQELKEKVERQVAELSDSGIPATLRWGTAAVGGAAHVIAEVASEDGADLIVVGTRGHTALAGLLVGSVTQRLLHIAPCPVLVVPAGRDHH